MSDVHQLPPPIWVDTPADLVAMVARLQGQPALAVDTESNSLYVYREQLCLIQISVPGSDYLVDSLVLTDLSALASLLADPAVLKVMHGAEYDLAVLHRDCGFEVSNLFDTMWASRILGWPDHGLAALLKTHFGVTLDKKYQRADWGLRPLPPQQLDYARLDTHYLLPLHELQAKELAACGRWPQAQHRFELLARTRWEAKEFDPDGFWRLPGARELDDAGRGVLRALYLYRDRLARSENCPPFKVLSNHALLALSQRRPESVDALRQIKGIPRRLVSVLGREVVAAIAQGQKQPLAWESRPKANNHSGRHGNGRPSAAARARFEALRAWRNEVAQKRGLEPDIILNNQDLWAVAFRNPRQRAELGGDGLLATWQVDEFGDDLVEVVSKTRSG